LLLGVLSNQLLQFQFSVLLCLRSTFQFIQATQSSENILRYGFHSLPFIRTDISLIQIISISRPIVVTGGL
ncbi:hypothetical protein V8E55_002727, partial [Tylopilus felleus]